jgi:hypothetical protein
MENFIEEIGIKKVISKPVLIDELSNIIRSILNESENGDS